MLLYEAQGAFPNVKVAVQFEYIVPCTERLYCRSERLLLVTIQYRFLSGLEWPGLSYVTEELACHAIETYTHRLSCKEENEKLKVHPGLVVQYYNIYYNISLKVQLVKYKIGYPNNSVENSLMITL